MFNLKPASLRCKDTSALCRFFDWVRHVKKVITACDSVDESDHPGMFACTRQNNLYLLNNVLLRNSYINIANCNSTDYRNRPF